MTRERIEDMREVVLPFVKKRLLETNYEGLGEADAEEFTRDFNEVLDMAIKALENEPRWIPVSEKKPDKGGEYLLWGKIDESEEEEYCFVGDYYEFEEKFGTEISNYDPKTLGFIDTEIEEYYSVVAWMPLPPSYERGKEE